jgi:HEAT repeat protein
VAKLFEDPDAWVRATLASAATRMSDRAAVPYLLALLRDPDRTSATRPASLERIQFVERSSFLANSQGPGLSATTPPSSR